MTLPSGGLAGRVLDGRYRIDRLLGRGGMAEVYLAHHLGLNRPCAVKVVHPSRQAESDATARFAREAEAASRIAHPHLCRTYDFGMTPEGIWYLAMEFIDGEPLAAVLAAGPLEWPRVLRIVSQCAAGLQAVHDAGLIHRDLKPENVMLTRREGVEVAILVDFGIAREPEGQGMTRDGLMVGTPEMMSPEQIAGDPVDARSDQYQLALLAYRLLTGVSPFPGESTQERMTSRLTGPPLSLDAGHPGLGAPAGVEQALQRALSRRPADRFASVRDFATALAGAAAGGDATELLERPGGGIHTGPRAEPTRIVPAPARPRGVVVVGTLAAAVLATGIWYVARDTENGGPTSPLAAADSTPAGPPSVAPPAPAPPPSAPTGAATTPTLPSEEAVYSADPAVRDAARRQAMAVYQLTTQPDTVRAEAAFLVAATYLSERLGATARVWLEHCLALQERAMCRRLLSTVP